MECLVTRRSLSNTDSGGGGEDDPSNVKDSQEKNVNTQGGAKKNVPTMLETE